MARSPVASPGACGPRRTRRTGPLRAGPCASARRTRAAARRRCRGRARSRAVIGRSALASHRLVGRAAGRRSGRATPASRTARRAGTRAAWSGATGPDAVERHERLAVHRAVHRLGRRDDRGRPAAGQHAEHRASWRRRCGSRPTRPDERARRLLEPRLARVPRRSRGPGSASSRTAAARCSGRRRARGSARACGACPCSAAPGSGTAARSCRARPRSSRSDISPRACAMNGICASSVAFDERAPGSASRANARISGSARVERGERRPALAQHVAQLGDRGAQVVLLAREARHRVVQAGDEVLERRPRSRTARRTPCAWPSSTRVRSCGSWPR